MSKFEFNKPFWQSGDTFKQLSPYNPMQFHKKATKTKALVALAMVCFLWGTTWLASKQGVKHMPALQLAGIRQFLGGSVYVLFFVLTGRAVWPKGREWVSIFILSFLNFILANGLSTWGVKYISAGLGAIIGAIFPLWLVVIGLFRASEKNPVKAVIGLLLGFAGICVIFYDHLKDFLNADFRFGILISIAATWAWAFGTIYTKEHAKKFNPYFGIGLQMFIAGISLLAGCRVSGISVPISEIPWQAWGAISYLLVFGSVISFIAYLYALQHLPTEQASIYAYINPVVAMLLGAAIFADEHLSFFLTVGGLITLYGVYLVNTAFKK
jgi:drug/metabolite transporter (DMT)-like permease